MTIMRALGALFAAIVLASCASAPSPQHGPAQIALQRTACFGFCPDYTVTIDEAGEVRYEGRRFVSAVGVRDAVIPREDVQRLLACFDEIGFERLRDEYRAQITDQHHRHAHPQRPHQAGCGLWRNQRRHAGIRARPAG